MKAQGVDISIGESCCARCHSEDGFEVVRGPRFRERLRGMAQMVIVPSLATFILVCVVFLWLGRTVTADPQVIADTPPVRGVVGLAAVLCGAAGVWAAILILATKPAARCRRCGAIEEREGG